MTTAFALQRADKYYNNHAVFLLLVRAKVGMADKGYLLSHSSDLETSLLQSPERSVGGWDGRGLGGFHGGQGSDVPQKIKWVLVGQWWLVHVACLVGGPWWLCMPCVSRLVPSGMPKRSVGGLPGVLKPAPHGLPPMRNSSSGGAIPQMLHG